MTFHPFARIALPVFLVLCQCLFGATPPVAALEQSAAHALLNAVPATTRATLTQPGSPLAMLATTAPSGAFKMDPLLPTIVDPMNPDNRIALFLEQKYWQAHENHLSTPRQLGANGCAAALWEYAIRPALAQHGHIKNLPTHLQVTYDILNFYKQHKLGQVIQINRADLDAAKIPPGSTLIGIKHSGDHHMLGAIELEGRWHDLPASPHHAEAIIPEERDGFSEAFVGNTGLQKFVKEVGYAHVRIQEFSQNHDLDRLNHHHGALDGNSAGNPYVKFIVLTWRQQPVDIRKDS
jgi:hypothetical protein